MWSVHKVNTRVIPIKTLEAWRTGADIFVLTQKPWQHTAQSWNRWTMFMGTQSALSKVTSPIFMTTKKRLFGVLGGYETLHTNWWYTAYLWYLVVTGVSFSVGYTTRSTCCQRAACLWDSTRCLFAWWQSASDMTYSSPKRDRMIGK